MKLVIFDRDWADEFSPFGFAVMTEAELEEFKKYYSEERTWYFGTNEGFEDEILFNNYAIKVQDITQEEADTLIRLFNLKTSSWSYADAGLFPGKPDEEE